MNGRMEGAISAVRDAIVTVTSIPPEDFGVDDDLLDDLHMDVLELEGLGLIVEEIFSVMVPDGLWATPMYRTASALAEWLIARSNEAAWHEAKRKRA